MIGPAGSQHTFVLDRVFGKAMQTYEPWRQVLVSPVAVSFATRDAANMLHGLAGRIGSLRVEVVPSAASAPDHAVRWFE